MQIGRICRIAFVLVEYVISMNLVGRGGGHKGHIIL